MFTQKGGPILSPLQLLLRAQCFDGLSPNAEVSLRTEYALYGQYYSPRAA